MIHLFAIGCTSTAVVAAPTGPSSAELQWECEQDLRTQFETARDQASFVYRVVAKCNEESLLSIDQQVDGYFVAANFYFENLDHEQSSAMFNKVTKIANDDHDLMNANRMLGIIEKSKLDYPAALNRYKAAWTHAQLADPDGEDMMSDSVLANICWLHHAMGMHEEGIDYAILGATYFQDSESELVGTAHYKYWQYMFNKDLGDLGIAHTLLSDLLDQHPKYGLLDNGNLRASLLMEKHKLLGHSWDNMSAELVAEAIDIINDDAYKFSTYRIHIVNKLAERYDVEYPLKAIEIRSTVYSKLMQDLDAAQLSDYDRELLLSRACLLPYNNAITFYDQFRDIDSALQELDLMLAQSHLPQDLAGLATDFRTRLVALTSP